VIACTALAAACATPSLRIVPARFVDFRDRTELAGIPVHGDGPIAITATQLAAAVAEGRLDRFEYDEQDVRLEGVRGGDLKNVRLLGGTQGIAIAVEPSSSPADEASRDLATVAQRFRLTLGALAFVSDELGLLYATEHADTFVAAAFEREQPPSFVGFVWARRRGDFARHADVIDLAALRARLAEASRADEPWVTRALVASVRRYASLPEVRDLLEEYDVDLDADLHAIANRFEETAPADLAAAATWTHAALRRLRRVAASPGRAPARVGAQASALVTGWRQRLAERMAALAAGAPPASTVEGTALDAIERATRDDAAIAAAAAGPLAALDTLVDRWLAVRVTLQVVAAWSEPVFSSRLAALADVVRPQPIDFGGDTPRHDVEPLPAMRGALAVELAPQLQREAEAAAADRRHATAAGLFLVQHGLLGGAATAERGSLQVALRGGAGPEAAARQHLAQWLAHVLPVPPATDDNVQHLGAAYAGAGPLRGTFANRVLGMATGSLQAAAEFVQAAGKPLGRFEIDAAIGGKVTCRNFEVNDTVAWLVTKQVDNSPAVTAHQQRLLELRAEIEQLDRNIADAHKWIGWEPGRSIGKRWTYVRSDHQASYYVESENLASAAARESTAKWQAERERLVAEQNGKLRNPPAAVLAQGVQRTATLANQWQEWNGTLWRAFRFRCAEGTKEWRIERTIETLRALRQPAMAEAGVQGFDLWLTEADLHAAFDRHFEAELTARAERLVILLFRLLSRVRAVGTDENWNLALLCRGWGGGEVEERLLDGLFGPPDATELEWVAAMEAAAKDG